MAARTMSMGWRSRCQWSRNSRWASMMVTGRRRFKSGVHATQSSKNPSASNKSILGFLAGLAGAGALAYVYPEAATSLANDLNQRLQTVKTSVSSLDPEREHSEETELSKQVPVEKPIDMLLDHLKPQAGIISDVKDHALFIVIKLNPKANMELCAKRIARKANELEDGADGNLHCSVGFSQNIWKDLRQRVPGGMPTLPFQYKTRTSKHHRHVMPSTGGDVFVHIKCDKTFECLHAGEQVLKCFPRHAILDVEDCHGFVDRSGSSNRDLLGMRIHTSNPETASDRIHVALVPNTGGSYALVQQWCHNLSRFNSLTLPAQEAVIGRRNREHGEEFLGDVDLSVHPEKLEDAIESGLPISSHVARVIGLDPDGTKLEIVRQSMPYGQLAPGADTRNERGKYFVAYAKDPIVFEYMLSRMMGTPIRGPPSKPRPHDSLLEYSSCIRGQYFYMPSAQQLQELAKLQI